MKKIFLGCLIVLATIFATLPAPHCSAADVWIAHWNSENIDIYVEDDTLTPGQPAHHFYINAKEVRNGMLLREVRWEYSKFHSDAWRYRTSTMRGDHTTIVIPRDYIFEYCMDQLGWGYTMKDSRYD